MTIRKKIKRTVRPTRRYLLTKQRVLKKHWRDVPKEEKTELKRLVLILTIAFLTIAAIYYIGINLLTSIGSFWATLRGQGGDLFQKDTIAPPPPYLAPHPLYTNSDVITVEGYAEAGAEIILSVNESEAGRTVAEKGGQFTFPSTTLAEGENKIAAVAKDGAGNESASSSTLRIILDKEPPELTVDQPAAGQGFSGADNKISVSGTTESGATVKVNDSQASVLADGSFTFAIIANQEGVIKITVVATDRAGNETKAEINVNYSSGTEE